MRVREMLGRQVDGVSERVRFFASLLAMSWRLERHSALSPEGRLHLRQLLRAKERAAQDRLPRVFVGQERAENEEAVSRAHVAGRSGAPVAKAFSKRQRIVAHVFAHSRIPVGRRRKR